MPDPLSRELADVFSQFGHRFMRWTRDTLREDGLTFPRMQLLWALEEEGPMIMTDLKDTLGITARSVTSLVDGLEADGHVQRRPHPDDRRATFIDLTEDGQATLARVHEAHQERTSILFEELDPEQREALLGIMEDLVVALDKTLDPTAAGRGKR